MRWRRLSRAAGKREWEDPRDLQVLRQRPCTAYLFAREERDPGVLRPKGRHCDTRRFPSDPAGRTCLARNETREMRVCVQKLPA